MKRITFPVGLYQCNCSILYCEETLEAVIVDPGDEGARITEMVEKKGLKVKYLLHTHAHLDHFGATADVKHKCNAKTVLHKDDLFLYEQSKVQSMMLGLPEVNTCPIDVFLEDGQVFSFGNEKVECLATPGHTPGSSCFCLEADNQQILLAGDTLFRNSIGRTDLPGGDFDTLKKSIKNRLYTLDGDCQVIPGHGGETLIGHEKRHNPFVQA